MTLDIPRDARVIHCLSMNCRRPFRIHQYDFELGTTLERGKILCPHCGAVMMCASTAVFLTYALTRQEEQRYADDHKD